jgi:meso-butanediol dehydrogenase / (S,S)-butanediol dehydrogenase / diacetyl reductase
VKCHRVLVTGGSSGIGREIVRTLAGCCEVFAVDKNEPAETLAPASFIKVDLTDEAAIQRLFRRLREEGCYPDALVNNAGVSHRCSLLETSLAAWQSTLAVNLTAPFLMAREFAAGLPLTAQATIVNIASVSGLVGMPNYLAYNVSKAGLISMTRTLAVELAPRIHTCAICPGYILTPMQRREYSPEDLEQCARSNPSRRLGSPEEVAELVAFVLSGKNRYFNGSVIVMDGGETAGGMAST